MGKGGSICLGAWVVAFRIDMFVFEPVFAVSLRNIPILSYVFGNKDIDICEVDCAKGERVLSTWGGRGYKIFDLSYSQLQLRKY